MEHFHNSTASNAADLNFYGGLNPAFLSAPTKRHSGLPHLDHAPVDLFAANAGLYIPPEETQAAEPVDELSGWTFSDDELMDTDDEDMDGNEFPDFAELEHPLPAHPEVFADAIDHTGHIPFEGVSPREPETFRVNPQLDMFASEPVYSQEQAYSLQEPHTDASQLNLQLHSQPSNAYPAYTPAYSYATEPELFSVDPACLTYPKTLPDADPMTGLNDFDLEMVMDDFYAPIANAVDLAELDKAEAELFPTNTHEHTPEQEQEHIHEHPHEHIHEHIHEHPHDEHSNEHHEHTHEPVSPPQLPQTDLHIPSPPDSPPAKSRRKTLPKRRAARAPASAAHSGPYVCNLTFHDGGECHRSFTRPYDLVRHQETLHAAVRKTFTCEVCGSHSKKFSRMDALSRHMRLKHAA